MIATGALFAVLGALPNDAEGQGNPQTREGFFIGFGIGGGSLGCDGCDGRQSGAAGYLKLGGALRPNILLAGEWSAWTKEEDDARLTHGVLAAIVQFYPAAQNGFFLKAGVGVSRLTASAAGLSASDDTFGVTAGLGYDIRLGTNFSLSPYASFGWGDQEIASFNQVQLGLGVTWH
jgi:hypothetical protein